MNIEELRKTKRIAVIDEPVDLCLNESRLPF